MAFTAKDVIDVYAKRAQVRKITNAALQFLRPGPSLIARLASAQSESGRESVANRTGETIRFAARFGGSEQ